MFNPVLRNRTWTTKKRTTEFVLHDVEKWQAQNNAECIDYAAGCLLDNLVMSCKRGIAFLFEEYVNEWESCYHVYFVPYKEQKNNSDYDALWDRFEKLQDLEDKAAE